MDQDLKTLVDKNPAALVGRVLDNQYGIDQYEISNFLGQGGMGAVYRAYHVTLRYLVAIKILLPKNSRSPEQRERFFREGKVVCRFNHPNAVVIHDLREASNGLIYMVMEYLEGQNLRTELDKRGIFSAQEALALIEPVANVLNAAHIAGVIHRDIKPENIMLSQTKDNKLVVKLLDFGMAKLEGAPNLTPEIRFLGTHAYMSPEQWGYPPSYFGTPEQRKRLLEGEMEEKFILDGRADIYSLGILLYEMVTGKQPIPGTNWQDFWKNHANYTPVSASALNPSVPQAFSQAIDHAITKNREYRPATCEEFIEQLRRAMPSGSLTSSAPIIATPPTTAPTANSASMEDLIYGKTLEFNQSNSRGSFINNSEGTFIDNMIGDFVAIPVGEFMMGSDNGWENEKPRHRVVISRNFEMGRYQVTQVQWEGITGSNPSYFQGRNLPVENVSWDDIQFFIIQLNRMSRKYSYRLPTEAVWEYCCRAGTTGDYAGNLELMAWYGNNSGNSTHPVGQKQANAWGLYDMHGNVWEWCQDWYGDYANRTETDPNGPAKGSYRVLRGGGWFGPPGSRRSAFRGRCSPDVREFSQGFRLVRSLK